MAAAAFVQIAGQCRWRRLRPCPRAAFPATFLTLDTSPSGFMILVLFIQNSRALKYSEPECDHASKKGGNPQLS